MQHRLEQIVDALITLFETLKQDTSVSMFPIKVYFISKEYKHWTALEEEGRKLSRIHRRSVPVFPALLLNFGSGSTRIKGGVDADFASLGQTEDHQMFSLIGLLKKTDDTPDDISDQVSDLIYSIERLINGTTDLGVDGVARVEIVSPPETSEGRASAVAGHPFEIVAFRIEVVHVYSASNFA